MAFVPCRQHEYFINDCSDCVSKWLKYCAFCNQSDARCSCYQDDTSAKDDNDEWFEIVSQGINANTRKRELQKLVRDSFSLPSGSKADRRVKACLRR